MRIFASALLAAMLSMAVLTACVSSTPAPEAPAADAQAQTPPREGMHSINDFMLGMTKEEAVSKGARLFPQDPSVLVATVDWNGIGWNAQLLFTDNKLTILVLTGPLNGEMVTNVLEFAGKIGYMPFSVQFGSTDVSIYEMAARGKTPAECDKILSDNLNAFSTGQDRQGTVMLSGMNLFGRLVAVIQNRGDENAILMDARDEPLLAMVMDRADGALIMIFSTWGAMTSD